MRSTHVACGLAGWLCIGLAVVLLAEIPEDSLAWWLWLGLPGLLVGTGLVLAFAVIALALYLSFTGPSRR